MDGPDARLPDELESALVDLVAHSTAGIGPGVEALCAKHPRWAASLRDRAERLQRHVGGHVIDPIREPVGTPGTHPAEIGPYRILEHIGHGGMGDVYKAEQRKPSRRLVAVKVIKQGMATKEVLARFRLEQKALASMSHGAIAKVFDAGATERGEPYFVMEFVEGIPFTQYCDRHKLTLPDRIALFQQVCAGVQHAHHKGFVHRDLKPGNVLVTREGDAAVAKILDFGLAKAMNRDALDVTLVTEQDRVMGTYDYMAPEQAAGDGEAIDARTDIYALGVLLYELLSGQLPFPGLRQDKDSTKLKRIQEEEPGRPSTRLSGDQQATSDVATRRRTSLTSLRKALAGDLDWVVLKAMSKEPERRYESAAALASDLSRYLAHEPVLAGPPTVGYRLRKFARRYRIQMAAAGVVFVALVAALGVSITFWRAARAQAEEADRQKGIAQEQARATEAARAGEAEKAKEAAESATLARRSATEATARKAEFDLLAGVVQLRRAKASAPMTRLAAPASLPEFDSWLTAQAQPLLATGAPVAAALATMRRDALPRTPEHEQADRQAHPLYQRWVELCDRTRALERADAIRNGAQLELPVLDATDQRLPALVLNDLAWSMVEPKPTRAWGDEARGLALALRAWQVGADLSAKERAAISDTLAWAWFANGKDGDAVRQARVSVDLDPSYELHLGELEAAIRQASAPEAAVDLGKLKGEAADLAVRLADAQTYRFADRARQFLHDELSRFVVDLREFDRREVCELTHRRRWAAAVEALTLRAWNGAPSWDAARLALARADGVSASTLYRAVPVDLMPQLGLVPLGMNPASLLWEFYDLRSAWDVASEPTFADHQLPRHEADGSLRLRPEHGVILVLVPVDARSGLLPFFLSKFELTRAQWGRLRTGAEAPADTVALHPAVSLSRVEAEAALRPWSLGLPTQEVWRRAFWCGADPVSPPPNQWLEQSALLHNRTRVAEAFRVGSFAANSWGFHDLLGNVSEWTSSSVQPLGNVLVGDNLGVTGPGLGLTVGLSWKLQYEAHARWFPVDGHHHPDRRADDLGVRPMRHLHE